MDKNLIRNILTDQKHEVDSSLYQTVSRSTDLSTHIDIPEITVVTGVRRCGKSTLLRQVVKNFKDAPIHFIDFEDQRLAAFSVNDFQHAYEEFLVMSTGNADKNQKQILIYDEIQLVKGWERWVAGLSSKKHIKVIISGSNSELLSSELSSLLTGRHIPLHVTPLSFHEILQQYPNALTEDRNASYGTNVKIARRQALQEYLKYGGFPRAFLGKDTKILGHYYEDILLKDIAVRRKVRLTESLKSLGSILASQNGRLFNRAKIAKEIGIKNPLTLAKFCEYFLETYLYSELRLYSRSRRTQLRGHSKYYAVDPLIAYQSGFHASESTYWILENHVANELRRRYREVFYWHSKKGYELDFLVRDVDGELLGVQVAMNISDTETRAREYRAFEAAKIELGLKRGIIITADEPDSLVDTKNPAKNYVQVVPFYDWAVKN